MADTSFYDDYRLMGAAMQMIDHDKLSAGYYAHLPHKPGDRIRMTWKQLIRMPPRIEAMQVELDPAARVPVQDVWLNDVVIDVDLSYKWMTVLLSNTTLRTIAESQFYMVCVGWQKDARVSYDTRALV